MQDRIIVCQRDYVLVQVDLPNELLMGRWLKEPTSMQYKAVITLSVLALMRYKITSVLINSQKKRPLTWDEQTWFLSKAQALLSRTHIRKIAYVHSSDLFQ